MRVRRDSKFATGPVLPLPFWNYVGAVLILSEEAPKSKMAPEEPYNSSGAASLSLFFSFHLHLKSITGGSVWRLASGDV